MPQDHPPPRIRAWIFRIALAAIAIAIILTVRYFYYAAGHPSTDDAFVQGDTVLISAKISGRVSQVLIEGDQRVTKEQLLVVLDPTDAQIEVRQAEAALAAAKTQVMQAQAALQSAEAQATAAAADVKTATSAIAAARAARDRTQRDYARSRELVAQGAIGPQQLDADHAAADVAEAQYQSALTQLTSTTDGARSGFAVVKQREAQVAAAQAAVLQAEAQVAAARRQLEETRILAPADGVVASQISAQRGQVVQPNQPLLMLVFSARRWVEANFKETQLKNVRVGQPATIRVDLLRRSFPGHVERLGPATGAALSLLPPQNATGNFTKVVQRIPVRIAIDDASNQTLQVGLSVEVTVDTTRRGAAQNTGTGQTP